MGNLKNTNFFKKNNTFKKKFKKCYILMLKI